MIGVSPGLSVAHASRSMPLARAALGLVPIVQATGMPSWQSMTGDRYTLPAGIENSVMSVTHSRFGVCVQLVVAGLVTMIFRV